MGCTILDPSDLVTFDPGIPALLRAALIDPTHLVPLDRPCGLVIGAKDSAILGMEFAKGATGVHAALHGVALDRGGELGARGVPGKGGSHKAKQCEGRPQEMFHLASSWSTHNP